jgi:hypothetical protein
MPLRELLVADANEAILTPGVKGGLAVAVVLVVAIAGIMSGLTLGLVSDRYCIRILHMVPGRLLHVATYLLLMASKSCTCQQRPGSYATAWVRTITLVVDPMLLRLSTLFILAAHAGPAGP